MYKKVQPLSVAEVEALPAVIGTTGVCGIGGISMPTARRLMERGTFKTARKAGHWRVSKREVCQYFGIEG